MLQTYLTYILLHDSGTLFDIILCLIKMCYGVFETGRGQQIKDCHKF